MEGEKNKSMVHRMNTETNLEVIHQNEWNIHWYIKRCFEINHDTIHQTEVPVNETSRWCTTWTIQWDHGSMKPSSDMKWTQTMTSWHELLNGTMEWTTSKAATGVYLLRPPPEARAQLQDKCMCCFSYIKIGQRSEYLIPLHGDLGKSQHTLQTMKWNWRWNEIDDEWVWKSWMWHRTEISNCWVVVVFFPCSARAVIYHLSM